jgi:uncharacterized protein (DUF1697 family)
MSYTFGFLRAINVGGRRITMPELAAILRDAELGDAETFIASGNFVFKGEGDAADIEALMVTKLGFCSEVYLRTGEEINQLVELAKPSALAEDVHAVHIGFVQKPPNQALQDRLKEIENELDRFALHKRDLIWTAKDRVSETPFGKKGLGGRIKGGRAWPPITWRNVRTLERMLVKWG